MRAAHLAVAGLLALAVVLPAQAQGKKRPQGPRKNVPLLDADRALKPGEVQGKLGAVAGNSFVLRLESQRLQPNRSGRQVNQAIRDAARKQQDLLRDQQRLAQLQARLRAARTPRQVASITRQIQQLQLRRQRRQAEQALRDAARPQKNPFKVVTDHKDYEVTMAPNVEVRTMTEPFAYDDMGNPKKFTREELAALKGKSNLPGYKSDVSALRPGQKVKVTLARNKDAGNKLQARRILIVEESNEPERPRKGGKKK